MHAAMGAEHVHLRVAVAVTAVGIQAVVTEQVVRKQQARVVQV